MPSLYVPGEPLEHSIQWLFPGKAFYKYSESGNDFFCIVYGQHPNASSVNPLVVHRLETKIF